MRVISLKSNTKLLKGVAYEADSFNNTATGSRWGQHRIRIQFPSGGYGSYLCKNFTDTSGNPLPQISYVSPNHTPFEIFDVTTLKANDIVVCNSDKYKYLVKGGKYRISEVADANTWTAQIRLEGYSRFIRFNSWSFRKLSLQETREIALSQIFNQPENFSVDFVRKFEKENNKTKILLQALSKSILDPYRHEYGVLDWTIEKTKNQDLKKDDFNEIMNMTLSEVLKLYEDSLL
jgi:hypothetical protein